MSLDVGEAMPKILALRPFFVPVLFGSAQASWTSAKGRIYVEISALRFFFVRILVGVVPASGIKLDSGRLCPTFDPSF